MFEYTEQVSHQNYQTHVILFEVAPSKISYVKFELCQVRYHHEHDNKQLKLLNRADSAAATVRTINVKLDQVSHLGKQKKQQSLC